MKFKYIYKVFILISVFIFAKQFNSSNVNALGISETGEYTSYKDVNVTNLTLTVSSIDNAFYMTYYYNPIYLKLNKNEFFEANKYYNLKLQANYNNPSFNDFYIKAYDLENNYIKTINYSLIDTSFIDSNHTVNYRSLLQAEISCHKSFYLIITKNTIINDYYSSPGLSDFILNEFSLTESDKTPPKITIENREKTIEVKSPITLDSIIEYFNIKAFDEVSGPCKYYIKEHNFNINKVGKYYVAIASKDNENNEAIEICYINVVDTNKPVISGWQGIYYTNYDNPISLDSILDKISAYDEVAGVLPVTVEVNNYTNYEKVLGNHFVVLQAFDGCNVSKVTINIVVMDITKPVIEGNSEYTSYISNPLTEIKIRNNLKVSDNVDKDIKLTLQEDNFTSNADKKGEFTLKYKAIDSSENESYFIVRVTSVDDIKPIITGINNYDITSEEILSIEDIKANLTITDNIDTNLELNIIKENYSNNHNIPGSYKIYFNTKDLSSNISEPFIVNINVKDTTKPTITGRKEYVINNMSKLELTSIIKNLEFNDNDKIIPNYSIIKDEYSDNYLNVGEYKIVLVAKDQSNNISDEFIVTIKVIDSSNPTFFISNDIIYVDESLSLTKEQILNILLEKLNIDSTSFKDCTIESNYFNNDKDVTSYNLKLILTMNDDTTKIIESKIEVITKESTTNDSNIENVGVNDKKEANNSFFSKIKEFFKNIFYWIIRYILFGWIWDKNNHYFPNF